MSDFEASIYEIVPERWEVYHLAKDIVASLNQEGRYEDVFEALKEKGHKHLEKRVMKSRMSH